VKAFKAENNIVLI